MARRFTAVAMLMGLLISMAVATAGPVAADTQYTCPGNTCMFSVPDSYAVASNDATQVIFTDSVSGGVFSAVVSDGAGLASLDDAVNAIASTAAASDSYQPGPNNGKSTILAGNPAKLVEYMAKNNNGLTVETAIFVTLYQGKVYQLIFVVKPENEDLFVTGAKPVFDSWMFM